MSLQAELDLARERIAQLEQALGARTLFHPDLRLAPMEQTILGILLKRPMAAMDTLELFVGRTRCRGEVVSHKTMAVHICHIRAKLKPHGIRIYTKYFEGWYLDPAGKERLRPFVLDGGPVTATTGA